LVLTIVAATLLLIFIFPHAKERAGMAYADVTKLNPTCVYNNNHDINPDMCCRELQKQLHCEKEKNGINCQTTEKYRYGINHDQYDYCNRIGYDLPPIG